MCLSKYLASFALIGFLALLATARPEYFPTDGFLPGWKGGPVKKYLSRDQLFAYMDGGAEVYLDYRFKRLEVREYTGPEKATLTIEIYEFETPQDAFGIFSQDTTGQAVDLGQGARASETLARFWKGSSYLRAFTWQSRPDLEGIPLQFLRAMAPKIMPGDLAVWLEKLSKADLRPVFLRSEATLQRLANVSLPGNVIINSNSAAAWISPQPPDLSGCLVLSYPDDSTAVDVFKGLWQEIAAKAQGSARSETRGMASLSDTLTQGVQRIGMQVAWVPAAGNEVVCAGTFDKVAGALAKIE
jgi:hypothetical protein